MALPEILLNSPTPGKREALTTLNVELPEAGLEMEWVANVPAAVQKPGQYRVTIDNEIILCEAKAGVTKKVTILKRAMEGTSAVKHEPGVNVMGLLTAGALQAYRESLAWKEPAAYASTEKLNGEPEYPTAETIKSKKEEKLKVDGAEPTAGQRIVVKNETEAKRNGIYEVVKAGKAGEKWELKRTVDANTTALLQDAVCLAELGTVNKGHHFTQVATVTTVGTTAQEWREGEVFSVATEAGLTAGTHNNWVPPNASVVVVTGSVEPIVTGMTGGEPGKIRVLRYAGTAKLILSNESIASTAANRFAFPSKENLTLSPGFEIMLIYVNERWTAQAAINGAKSIEGGSVSPAEVPTPEPEEGPSALLSVGAKSPIGRLQVWSVTMTKGRGSTWKLNHNLENLATSIIAVWQGTAVAESGGEESKPEKQIITPSTVIKEVKPETNNRLVVTFVKEPVSGTEVFFLLVEG